MLGVSSPDLPDPAFFSCLRAVFRFPSGLIGLGAIVLALAILLFMVMRMGYSDGGGLDRARNFEYSTKGTYGTAGFMSKREMKGVVDSVSDIRKHHGIILGELDGKVLCLPEKTRFNGNLAVYGASGSKKTRSFCMNIIIQCASRDPMTSLIICDPKSELYEKSSEYLRDKGYVVRKFDLVTPSSSDSWNCLSEIGGQDLMAQLFCDVIIKNTGSGKGDHFWDNAEMNLLKALVLYVERSFPEGEKNIGEAYKLLFMSSEKELNAIFDALPMEHPAKAPYNIFKQSSESVRGGVIIGLGSRLQVFQNSDIREITSHNEIDLELPGKQPCAYFCITSDQDSTFDFLSSLFLSFVFIKLVRFADQKCEGGALPVPVHVLGEELCACGVIPDLSRKISVIRSRNISMSCVFQNLAGLQNRYPLNQWQEILGNCDITLFLGCTDALTAQFISDRTGEASINVTSKAKQLNTWRVSNYTPEYRETSGVGRRKLYTMDEVLRLDLDRALVIIRGKNILEVNKYDYSKHPESRKMRAGKASAHIPAWRLKQGAQAEDAGKQDQPEKKAKPKSEAQEPKPPDKPTLPPTPQSGGGKPGTKTDRRSGKSGMAEKEALKKRGTKEPLLLSDNPPPSKPVNQPKEPGITKTCEEPERRSGKNADGGTKPAASPKPAKPASKDQAAKSAEATQAKPTPDTRSQGADSGQAAEDLRPAKKTLIITTKECILSRPTKED